MGIFKRRKLNFDRERILRDPYIEFESILTVRMNPCDDSISSIWNARIEDCVAAIKKHEPRVLILDFRDFIPMVTQWAHSNAGISEWLNTLFKETHRVLSDLKGERYLRIIAQTDRVVGVLQVRLSMLGILKESGGKVFYDVEDALKNVRRVMKGQEIPHLL